MRRNAIAIIFICLIGAVALGFYLYPDITATATISPSSSKPVSKTSSVGFQGLQGETVEFSFTSGIKEGAVEFQLLDGDNKAVKTFGPETANDTAVTLEESGGYTLTASLKDFVGKFKLNVYVK